MFKKYDTNKDEEISREEFEREVAKEFEKEQGSPKAAPA